MSLAGIAEEDVGKDHCLLSGQQCQGYFQFALGRVGRPKVLVFQSVGQEVGRGGSESNYESASVVSSYMLYTVKAHSDVLTCIEHHRKLRNYLRAR